MKNKIVILLVSAKGIIDVGTFKTTYNKTENERAVVKAEYDRLAELLDGEEHRILNANRLIPELKKFLELENMTYEMLVDLIDHIVVNESVGRSRYKTHKVQIVYRFEDTI